MKKTIYSYMAAFAAWRWNVHSDAECSCALASLRAIANGDDASRKDFLWAMKEAQAHSVKWAARFIRWDAKARGAEA